MYFQIVCGSCGQRIRSDLLDQSLETNRILMEAIAGNAKLKSVLDNVPEEIKKAVKGLYHEIQQKPEC